MGAKLWTKELTYISADFSGGWGWGGDQVGGHRGRSGMGGGGVKSSG